MFELSKAFYKNVLGKGSAISVRLSETLSYRGFELLEVNFSLTHHLMRMMRVFFGKFNWKNDRPAALFS